MAATMDYKVSWNDFHTNLTSGFKSLFNNETISDVTLAVDGHLIQAHRVVLSICSSFFRQLFELNRGRNPIIIVPEVSLSVFKQLLEYMYLGEVSVNEGDVATFIKVAQVLKVNGLIETHDARTDKDPQPLTQPLRTRSPYWFWKEGLTSKQQKLVRLNDGLTEEEHVLATKHERNLRPRSSIRKTQAAIDFEASKACKRSKTMDEQQTTPPDCQDDVVVKEEEEDCDGASGVTESDLESLTLSITEDPPALTDEVDVSKKFSDLASLAAEAIGLACADSSTHAIIRGGGIPRLVIDGFEFKRQSFYRTKSRAMYFAAHWVCMNRSVSNCPAECYSMDDIITVRPKQHNHTAEIEPAGDGDILISSDDVPKFLHAASMKESLNSFQIKL